MLKIDRLGAALLAVALLASVSLSATALPPMPGLAAWETYLKGHNTTSPPTIKGPEYYAYTFPPGSALGAMAIDNHYDAIRVFYEGRDYAVKKIASGDTSWNLASFDAAIAAAVRQYRDLYAGANSGSATGYYAFSNGLLRHYIDTGDAYSRDIALVSSLQSAWSNDVTPLAWLATFEVSREVAFSILMRLNSEDLGQAHRTRTDEMVTAALGHIDEWLGPRSSCLYVRPFMMGLTMEALIAAWDRSRDARIPPKIKQGLDWMRANTWNPAGGMTPGTGSFVYTDIETSTLPTSCSGYGSGGREDAPDLSLLIAPAYMWYYWYSKNDTYRVWAEEAWLGSSALAGVFWSQKQYNQSYRWSTRLLDWRERGEVEWPAPIALKLDAPSVASGRANAPSTPFSVSLSSARRHLAQPLSVTPSDGGAGGVFIPAKVTLTTDRPSGIFRYRPMASAQGAVAISITNTGTLANPAAVTYSVVDLAPLATGYQVSGPTSGSVGASARFTVSLVPPDAVPPFELDPMGGFVLFGATDGAGTGWFLPAAGYPREGAVVLAPDRPSSQFSYTPTALGVTTLAFGTGWDGLIFPTLPLPPSIVFTAYGNRADQTITFAAIADRALGTGAVPLNATASSGLAVSFGPLTPATCTVSGSTAVPIAVGTCTIRASQPGDGSFNAAPDVDRSFIVTTSSARVDQTIAFAALADRALDSGAFNVSASASSGLVVTFVTLTSTTCSITGSTVTLIATGACTLRASQAGNGSYNAASDVDRSFVVTASSSRAHQVITFAALADRALNSGTFSVTATASSGLVVTFVTLTSTTCSINGSTVTLIATGTCTLRASQGGNASHDAAANVDQSFNITAAASAGKLNQTIDFAIIADQSLGSSPVRASASASSGLPVALAVITPNTCAMLASGLVGSIRIGVCTLRATQSGNSQFNAASAFERSFNITTPSSIAEAVEFQHAGFDHYFVSASTSEITDLDSGRHAGWSRTGKSVRIWMTSAPDRSPVCRFYIPPAWGDSHFYSASPIECGEVARRFGSMMYESPAVFYSMMPDMGSGACPAQTTPVYRVWNQRTDSNHRYTTDLSLRDEMVRRGYVAEGYGPNGVVMCAPL